MLYASSIVVRILYSLSFHHNPRVEVIPISRIRIRQLRFRDVSNLSEVTQLPNTEARF